MPTSSIGGGGLSAFWDAVKTRFRLFIFGRPLATSVQLEHRLPILLALPVFASDAVSSVAYGPEEVLKELSKAASQPLHLLVYFAIAISLLMVIVATSYMRAVHLYPSSGGSYTVAKSNLGAVVGLIAAAALLIDYILTVAVSISSGVDALKSALPKWIDTHVAIWVFTVPVPVLVALLLVGVIALANLRGTKESGWTFALPLYGFAVMVALMTLSTVYHLIIGGGHVPHIGSANTAALAMPENILKPEFGVSLGLLLILRSFSNGCSAMTGVEAVSNGVSAFKPPEAKHAAQTLLLLLVILMTLFLGTSVAAHYYHALPSTSETILSQVTRANFGRGILYGLTQFFTLTILMVAANTSYADFPRLLAFVARDGYAPKTFVSQGDRLVYNRGIITLTLISALLIIAFTADVSKLIGLYSIGVFLCFTLSQLGMAKKIRDLREKGWVGGFILNIIGMTVTGVVTIVVAVSKFGEGAWMVLVLIPIIIGVCLLIKRHYEWFDETMTVHDHDYNPLSEPEESLTVLVLVSSDVHRGILEGLECGRAIAASGPNNILRAVHIEMDPDKTPRLQTKWEKFVEPYMGEKIRLDVIPSPYRWLIEPIMDYLDWTDLERGGDRIIVVLPEFETGSWITQLLHNFTGNRLRSALLNRPHVTVVSSRYFMKPMAWRLGRGGLVY